MQENHNRRDETQPLKDRRPFVLTIILVVFLLWILLGWLRFAGVLRGSSLVLSLVPPGIRLYLMIAGLVWGLAGLPIVWGLVTRAPWTVYLIRPIAVFYPAVYWFERLFLWQDPDAGRNWPFMLLLTLMWLALVFGATRLKKVQQFFKGHHK